MNPAKHPWFSHCTWKNKVMFNRISVAFKTISVPFTCTRSKFLCAVIVTSWSRMGLWRHWWCRQWLGWVYCTDWEWHLRIRFDSGLILFHFLNYFTFHVIKGIRNGCPCVVQITGTLGCALSSSLTNAQPCVVLISTMHGQTFVIPLST